MGSFSPDRLSFLYNFQFVSKTSEFDEAFKVCMCLLFIGLLPGFLYILDSTSLNAPGSI